MGLLGDYLPGLPDDPNQNSAARQGLLAFGAALLGGRGNFGQILGQGLASGAGGYNSALQALQQKALVDAQTKHYTLENDATQAKLDEPGQIAQILGASTSAAPLPGGGGAQAALVTGATPLSSLPQMSPAPDAVKPLSMIPQASSAPQVPAMPAAAPKPATQADRAGLFDQYIGMGDKLAQAGKMAYAKQYYDLAEKLKPEVLKTEDLIDRATGEPVHVMTFKDGSTKVAPFGSMPDYQVVNNGKTNDLIDKRTGKKGASYAISVSPDSEYSRQTQYGVQGMIGEREKANAKTQVVTTDDGIVLVNKDAGTAKPIIGADGKPVAGVTKPLNDSQSKALLFGTRMQEAHKILDKLSKDEKVTTSTPGSRTPVIGGLVTALSSDSQQMLDQAKRDFINATLRRESGASIMPSEFDSAEKQYFPQIGDGEKVIAQKARNRELAIKGMLAEVPEKQRASITPVADLPKKPQAGIPTGWKVEKH